MEIGAVILCIAVLIFMLGGNEVEKKAEENTKDTVSAGLGCIAVIAYSLSGLFILGLLAVGLGLIGGN